MPLSTGEVINNRYRIVILLGQGGFGAVYKAWDLNLKVPCAFKENLDTRQSGTRQFEREASFLATLRHPGLPRVTDYFILEGQGQYLVMDYIEGQDLKTILANQAGPLPEAQVVGWLGEILDALDYLHTQQIPVIHRDIKPANIKITPAGKAILVDFGIAKVYNPDLRTTQGARAFTPGYAPFEQYGQAPTDARTDIYALGATAYTLLTNQTPIESITRMTGASLKPPRSLNPAISRNVEAAILKAMEPMPENRFQSAREFKAALFGNTPPPVFQPTHSPQPMPMSAMTTEREPEQPAARPGLLQTDSPVSKPPPLAQSRPKPKAAELRPRKKSRNTLGILFAILVGGAALVLIAAVVALFVLPNLPGRPTAQAGALATTAPATALPPTSPPDTPAPPTRLPDTQPAATAAVQNPPPTGLAPAGAHADFKACLVTDSGGIHDQSYNAATWHGVELAQAKFGIQGKFFEPQSDADYQTSIKQFMDERCNLIITVGFLLADATKTFATANPDQKFTIVDYAYDPPLPNVISQVYATDQAAFLAGYLAAGMTKTGVVGVFGGQQIPPVTIFMDGYALGVEQYNLQHGTKVAVLGWDAHQQTGLFSGDFSDQERGRQLGEQLISKGADIILPVAGPVGLGAAAAARNHPGVYIIGVDTDWVVTAPDTADIILTSVLKNTDVMTFNAIMDAISGKFSGRNVIGNLENGGVGLAPYHNLEKLVPDGLRKELDDLRAKIIAGQIKTLP